MFILSIDPHPSYSTLLSYNKVLLTSCVSTTIYIEKDLPG